MDVFFRGRGKWVAYEFDEAFDGEMFQYEVFNTYEYTACGVFKLPRVDEIAYRHTGSFIDVTYLLTSDHPDSDKRHDNYTDATFYIDAEADMMILKAAPVEHQKPTTEARLNDTEREYLFRTIGSLALLLIEKTDSKKFGSRDNPNKAGIYSAIQQLLSDMESSDEGQSKTRLNDILKEAITIAIDSKQK